MLDEAAPLKDDSGLVFPGVKGKPLSDMTLTKVLRDNGLAAPDDGSRFQNVVQDVVHGDD